MALEYKIDTDKGIIFATASESITLTGLMEHMRRVMENTDFDPGYDTVLTIEPGTRTSALSEMTKLREIVRGYAGIRKGTKWAAVVDDGFSCAIAGIIVAAVQPKDAEIQVFSNRPDAIRWVTEDRA